MQACIDSWQDSQSKEQLLRSLLQKCRDRKVGTALVARGRLILWQSVLLCCSFGCPLLLSRRNRCSSLMRKFFTKAPIRVCLLCQASDGCRSLQQAEGGTEADVHTSGGYTSGVHRRVTCIMLIWQALDKEDPFVNPAAVCEDVAEAVAWMSTRSAHEVRQERELRMQVSLAHLLVAFYSCALHLLRAGHREACG